jgi:hypothetical protein
VPYYNGRQRGKRGVWFRVALYEVQIESFHTTDCSLTYSADSYNIQVVTRATDNKDESTRGKF